MFTLGRFTGVKGPGLILLIPIVQQMVRVDLRTLVLDVPSPGRHLARQRLGQGQRGDLLPGRDPERSVIQVENFVAGHQPAGADHAALGARQARPRRDAGRARQAQQRHPGDPRRADRCLGHQGRQRRDQAHRHRREHDPRHRPAGRSRARAARQGHQRRGRGPGGRRSCSRPPGILAQRPEAMQLRYLLTLDDIGSENSSTIVFPFPIDMLRELAAAARGSAGSPGGG